MNLVHELTYLSYRYNRERSPEIPASVWEQLFPDADTLEQRYREEQNLMEQHIVLAGDFENVQSITMAEDKKWLAVHYNNGETITYLYNPHTHVLPSGHTQAEREAGKYES